MHSALRVEIEQTLATLATPIEDGQPVRAAVTVVVDAGRCEYRAYWSLDGARRQEQFGPRFGYPLDAIHFVDQVNARSGLVAARPNALPGMRTTRRTPTSTRTAGAAAEPALTPRLVPTGQGASPHERPREVSMFHLSDGFFFDRLPDGRIRIRLMVPTVNVMASGENDVSNNFAVIGQTVVDANAFASVISVVSFRNTETYETWAEAVEYLTGKRPEQR